MFIHIFSFVIVVALFKREKERTLKKKKKERKECNNLCKNKLFYLFEVFFYFVKYVLTSFIHLKLSI